jgi:hypothetical protein
MGMQWQRDARPRVEEKRGHGDNVVIGRVDPAASAKTLQRTKQRGSSAGTLRDEIASCERTVANQVASPLKGPAPARSTVDTVGWAAAAVELAAVTVAGGEAKTVV